MQNKKREPNPDAMNDSTVGEKSPSTNSTSKGGDTYITHVFGGSTITTFAAGGATAQTSIGHPSNTAPLTQAAAATASQVPPDDGAFQLPTPYFDRKALRQRVRKVLWGYPTLWDALLAFLGTKFDGRRLCVLTGPPGFGKSSLARKIALEHRAGSATGRVLFCAWPNDLAGIDVKESDFVIIDDLRLSHSSGGRQLDWIAQLPCPTLVTANTDDAADRLLGHCSAQADAERLRVAVPPLGRRDSWTFIAQTLGPERTRRHRAKLKVLIPHLGGSPFFHQLLVECVRDDNVPDVDARSGDKPVQERLAAAWVGRLRESEPDAYRTLTHLTLVTKFGTSTTYLARLTNIDVSRIKRIVADLGSRGLLSRPIAGDTYLVPHDLIRAAFKGELSDGEIREGRERYFRLAKGVIQEGTQQESFAATLDAIMLSTIRGFAENNRELLVECATLLNKLPQCKLLKCSPLALLPWLNDWMADTVFESCEGAIAVARTLQEVTPRSELLGNVILRAVPNKDTYASIEAILAATLHWRDLPDGPRSRAAEKLVGVAETLLRVRTKDEAHAWLLGINLYALACAVDVLVCRERAVEAAKSWIARVQGPYELTTKSVVECAEAVRSAARQNHRDAAGRLEQVAQLATPFRFLRHFVCSEMGTGVDGPSKEISIGFDLIMAFARLGHYTRCEQFLWHLANKGLLRGDRLVLTYSQFRSEYRTWAGTAPPL